MIVKNVKGHKANSNLNCDNPIFYFKSSQNILSLHTVYKKYKNE